MPWWLSGLLFAGIYLATAWVIAVMLPPMAIFFPLFTLLEDSATCPGSRSTSTRCSAAPAPTASRR